MTGEKRVSLYVLIATLVLWIALASVDVAPFRIASYFSNFVLYMTAWVIFISLHILAILARERPERPLRHMYCVRLDVDYRQKLTESWPILLISVIFMPTFSAMKSAIPLFNDYSWDQALINLDSTLHGDDPWKMIQPMLGHPLITSAISAVYHVWILLIYSGTIFFTIYVNDRNLRTRYFASYFSIWIVIGIFLATAFASVGPCFAHELLGIERFNEQMEYLRSANESYPVLVLDVQEKLIAWHNSGSHGLGRGITAMPSMHVALAFLFYLAIRRVSRKLGMFFLGFFVIIMIGSVHLAYHYAVDGYVSIAVTGLIWYASGKIFKAPATAGSRDASPARPLAA